MKQRKGIALDFIIDKLTNSVENVHTGDSFATEVSLLTSADVKTIGQKNGWLFDWKYELKQPAREVYKLTIVHNPAIIQGLVSLEMREDHVYMHLVESAPFNKGREKIYAGVPGNLVAFACRLSFQRGFGGNVKTLGAFHFGGRVMIIETDAALKLIDRYFK